MILPKLQVGLSCKQTELHHVMTLLGSAVQGMVRTGHEPLE